MADEVKTTTLIIQARSDGVDQAITAVGNLEGGVNRSGAAIDAAMAKYSAGQDRLNSLSTNLDSISSKLDITSKAAGAAAAGFDSIGWDPAASGAAQLSGRLSEVSSGFGALSQVSALAASAIGTHGDAVAQAADRYDQLREAQSGANDSSALSTAEWIALGVAGVALVGVTAGVVVGVIAAKDALIAAADATATWAKEMLTGGILDNMQQLIATGKQLDDISATTGVAAVNMSILATGLQGSGVQAGTTASLLGNLSKALTGADDQAVSTRATLRDMGIDVDALGKRGNDAQAVFLAFADKMATYQDGLAKSDLAQKVLGDSSAEVIRGLDGASAAFARMDAQTRANIANIAAYAAETQNLITKFKDLRDNEPATLSQSQFSGAVAEMGGGYEKFAAGFDGGSGVFSAKGRAMAAAGLDDLGTGIEAAWDTLDAKFQAGAVSFFTGLDNLVGSQLTSEMANAARDRQEQLQQVIQSELPTQTPDMRSPPSAPAEGSYQWATSAGTQFVAQFDTGTKALQDFTVAYSKVIDAMDRGVITEDQATAAIAKLTQNYADAIGKFDQFVQAQAGALQLRQRFAPGAARDAATLEQQLLSQAAQANGGDLNSEEVAKVKGLAHDISAQNGADQVFTQNQANVKAAQENVKQIELQTAAQDRLTSAIGQGWTATEKETNANTVAAAVAANNATDVGALTAALNAQTEAKQRNIDAASADKLQQQLDIAKMTTEAHQAGAAAVADLAVQTGHYQNVLAGVSSAQQILNDQMRQQIELQSEEANAADYLNNLQEETQIAQTQLDILTQTKGLRTEEVTALKLKLDIEKQFPNLAADERNKLIEQAQHLAEIKGEIQDQTRAYQEQQRQIEQVSNDIASQLGQNLTIAFKGGTDAWSKMLASWHATLDTFLANLVAQFAKTELIIPVVTDLVGSIGSTGSLAGGAGGNGLAGLLGGSAGNGSGGSVLGSVFGTASSASSLSGMLGGPTIGSSLGLSGSGSLLSGAGTYLFGTAGTGVGDIAGATTPDLILTTPSFAIEGGETVGAGSYVVPGVAGDTISGSGTSGLLGSGGAAVNLAPVAGGLAAAGGGFLAGDALGGAVGSPGAGALAGAAGGAATGALIGTFILPGIGTAGGAVIGGLAGAIGGALGGQHPTVGPNEGGYVFTKDGVASAGPTGADNGGSTSEAEQLQRATIAGIQNLTAAIGGIGDLNAIRVGAFGGKYFGTGDGSGGSPKNAIYQNDADAVANAILDSLKHSDLSKIDPNVSTAIQHIPGSTASSITSAQTISDDLTFAEQFSASIKAMKNGVTDFAQAAETAAQVEAQKLVTSIEDFKNKTAELGLSTQDAADATKSAIESFLGLKAAQPVSQLEASVETLYGKLEGVAGLLKEVGISQETATAAVKAQVLNLIQAATTSQPVDSFVTQLNSLNQTFTNLAPTLSALGISASDSAKALNTAIATLRENTATGLVQQFNQSSGLNVLNQLATAAATYHTNLQTAGDLGGGSWTNIANGTFNNSVYTALDGIAGNTKALDVVIQQFASDTTSTGKAIEDAAIHVKNFGAVIVGVGNDAATSLTQQFNQSAGLDILNTLSSAVKTYQSNLQAAGGLGGGDWTNVANGTFNNTVFSALDGIAGNTSALNIVIQQYANDTTAAGKQIEAAAQQVKNFGQVVVGVGNSSASIQSIQNFLSNLLTTGQTPAQNYTISQGLYQQQIALAQGGDQTALSNITQYAQRYLQSAQTMYATGPGYQSAVSSVEGQLGNLPEVKQWYDKMLDTLASIEADAAKTVANTDAISGNTAGMTKAIDVAVNLDVAKSITVDAIDSLAKDITDPLTLSLLKGSQQTYTVNIAAIDDIAGALTDPTLKDMLTQLGKKYSIDVYLIDDLLTNVSDQATKELIQQTQKSFQIAVSATTTVATNLANDPAAQKVILATGNDFVSAISADLSKWPVLTPAQQAVILGNTQDYSNSVTVLMKNWATLTPTQQTAIAAANAEFTNTMNLAFGTDFSSLTTDQQAALIAQTSTYTKTINTVLSAPANATTDALAALHQEAETITKTINQNLTVNGNIVNSSNLNGSLSVEVTGFATVSTYVYNMGNLIANEIRAQTGQLLYGLYQTAIAQADLTGGATNPDWARGFPDQAARALQVIQNLPQANLSYSAPPSVPKYASGTLDHPGGLALVGEDGPELLNLPAGSQVFNRMQIATGAVGGAANDNGGILQATYDAHRAGYAAMLQRLDKLTVQNAELLTEIASLRATAHGNRHRALAS